ncbi:MAG: rhodanese-like domain-containing protein [Phyllobacteriaceae bacterium]|nr:rhodanese-like domain-containing protein [Phyllobacteriaceae bacterium]
MNFAALFNRGNAAPAGAISYDELAEAVATKSATIVDVREAHEFRSGAIEGAINVPMSAFNPSKIPANKPVVVYCLSGARSSMAQQILQANGFADVRNFRSGIGVWRMQGGNLV